jgi:chromate transporter
VVSRDISSQDYHGHAHYRNKIMPPSPPAIFRIFLRLGCTSFGGPIAHIGYFRTEFVERRNWLDDQAFADLVAICQFTPGPASSKVGIALGALQAGIPGAIAAWLGFTAPSALILIAFGYGLEVMRPETLNAGWLHGLKIAAVAVVAQAVWNMGRQLCPDRVRASFAILAALFVLSLHNALSQIAVIVVGALAGWRLLPGAEMPSAGHLNFPISRRLGWTMWVLFLALLAMLPVLAATTANHAVALFDSFYRVGSLVFGGGHVVLPILRAEVVPTGWVSDDAFLAGYGVAQAVPGPLFTFAAYLGTVAKGVPTGWAGGVVTLLAIFLPAFFLALGPLPFWSTWRRHPTIRSCLSGVNATVVGILLAALYDPIFTTSVRNAREFALALAAFGLLFFWRLAPLWVVAFAAAGGEVIALLP